MKTSKLLKIALISFPLIAAGYLFGTICNQVSLSYNLMINPSINLIYLLIRLIATIFIMAVTAGLVAALIRPVYLGSFVFLLSGISILLGWQVLLVPGILTLIYVIAATFYTIGIANELRERIKFSVRPIIESQRMLLMALLIVSCGSLYLGCLDQINRDGLIIPDTYIEIFMKPLKQQILGQMPEPQREKAAVEMEDQFQGMVDRTLEETIKPYERYIPLMIAGGVLLTLNTILSFLSWIPPILISIILQLFKEMKIISEISETKEVKRIVI